MSATRLKIRFRTAICCLILMSAAVSANAQSSDASHRIQALYDQAGGLLAKQDVKGFINFLRQTRTRGYVYMTKFSHHTLDEMVKSMAMVLSTYRVTMSSVHIEKIKQTGNEAVVTVTSRIGLETIPQKSKAKHTIDQVAHGEDSWVLLGNEWKLKLSRVESESALQDGHPLK